MDELIVQIENDQKFRVKVEEQLSINIVSISGDTGVSTTKINGQFVFSQILIDYLLRMKSDERDKHELICLCEKEYNGNKNHLKLLREFQRDYSSDKVLRWYTRESFFYKILNKALRTQNIHILFLFRSYIYDIHCQLERYQCKRPLRTYRCQLISVDELCSLKNHIGQFISINSFFSTSIERPTALFYLGSGTAADNLQRVLFEIDADPRVVTTKHFADITSHSEFDSELEVLFMLGSTFRLTNIRRDDDNLWIIQMKLCGDEEHDLKRVLVHLRNQNGRKETNLRSFSKFLLQMGKFDLAEKYCCRQIDELQPNDPLHITLYDDLSQIASHKGDLDASIQWSNKMLEMKMQISPSNDIGVSELNDPYGQYITTKLITFDYSIKIGKKYILNIKSP